MAKIIGPHQQPRAPSLRGAFVVSPRRAGLVASAWRKPAPKKLSKKQQEAIAKFKEAAAICKYAPAADQVRSRELAKGSQFLPRDLQYMAIYGRLCSLFFTNGERRYSMASRYDLTELLDILGFQPGTILFRGSEFWETLAPPDDTRVLISDGASPRWGAGNDPLFGGGGFDGVTFSDSRSADTSPSATKGTFIQPYEHVDLTAVTAVFQSNAQGDRYRAVVARVDTNSHPVTVIGPVTKSAYITIDTYDNAPVRFDLPTNFRAEPGQIIMLGMQIDGPDPTSAARPFSASRTSNLFLQNGPFTPIIGSARWNTLDLQPSDVSQAGINSGYFIWAAGRLA